MAPSESLTSRSKLQDSPNKTSAAGIHRTDNCDLSRALESSTHSQESKPADLDEASATKLSASQTEIPARATGSKEHASKRLKKSLQGVQSLARDLSCTKPSRHQSKPDKPSTTQSGRIPTEDNEQPSKPGTHLLKPFTARKLRRALGIHKPSPNLSTPASESRALCHPTSRVPEVDTRPSGEDGFRRNTEGNWRRVNSDGDGSWSTYGREAGHDVPAAARPAVGMMPGGGEIPLGESRRWQDLTGRPRRDRVELRRRLMTWMRDETLRQDWWALETFLEEG